MECCGEEQWQFIIFETYIPIVTYSSKLQEVLRCQYELCRLIHIEYAFVFLHMPCPEFARGHLTVGKLSEVDLSKIRTLNAMLRWVIENSVCFFFVDVSLCVFKISN